QVGVCHKPLSALVARERLVAGVEPLVNRQRAALGEHLSAQRALVPPLPSVRSVVRLHVLLVREPLVAVVAREGFLAGVDACVALQRRCGGEPLVAHGAGVGSLAGVGSHV
ncbi:hypothetical protein EGW08_020879, partial [Elysia chlorotica]